MGIRSDDDPLRVSDLHKIIKAVKPKGLDVVIVTKGSDPSSLDDLVGAGYVHSMDLLIGKEPDEDQLKCIAVMKDNRCRFAVTIEASEHDRDSIEALEKSCKGCSMFIIRTDRNKPLKRNELSALTSAAKKITWNVRTV